MTFNLYAIDRQKSVTQFIHHVRNHDFYVVLVRRIPIFSQHCAGFLVDMNLVLFVNQKHGNVVCVFGHREEIIVPVLLLGSHEFADMLFEFMLEERICHRPVIEQRFDEILFNGLFAHAPSPSFFNSIQQNRRVKWT